MPGRTAGHRPSLQRELLLHDVEGSQCLLSCLGGVPGLACRFGLLHERLSTQPAGRDRAALGVAIWRRRGPITRRLDILAARGLDILAARGLDILAARGLHVLAAR